MDRYKDSGSGPRDGAQHDRDNLRLYINLKLTSSGQPPVHGQESDEFLYVAHDLLMAYRAKNWLLSGYLSPPDRRIQDFLERYLEGVDEVPHLPRQTFILDHDGLARELSLPVGEDVFRSDIMSSYRVRQGVLHNPASDRRTTKGSFHIAEGGLPIPGDKKAVPREVFARMLGHAFNPPEDVLALPYTVNQPEPARMFVSLLMRPLICPAIPGVAPEKSMEIRFFAPGNLVSNLDFVESIFGNDGNPFLPEHDAALDVEHWSGHTGCVVLASHLVGLTKRELGLPHWDDANERQRREGMCWKEPGERYNDGQAFKLTARDASGAIVTILADNYYGYCKKEVKSQISFAANLYGLAEEEHAGGALVFHCRNHGEEYGVDSSTREPGYSFQDTLARYGQFMRPMTEGHALDVNYPDIIYVPQAVRFDLNAQSIAWEHDGRTHQIRLMPGKIYMQPNGYKVEMRRHPGAPSWRLVGIEPEGTFCHKPCTVSGGGKSEISKSLEDAVIYGPLFIDHLERDLAWVRSIFERDYSARFRPGFEQEDRDAARKPLSMERSLGSVIKLLTPSSSYTDEYNAWLDSVPPRILALVFLIKRFYRPEWGERWDDRLSVDVVDGAPGHELKMFGRRIIASYLRVGFDADEQWRTFKLRQDFIPAEKVQMEDDITASVVAPVARAIGCRPGLDRAGSVKLTHNCEMRLFQRPDDAIVPGYDKQTEADMARPGNFLANYEPLTGAALAAEVDDVMSLYGYTQPMRELLLDAARAGQIVASSARPRLVDGKPSKNPRYLQLRPDIANPMRKYAAEMGMRFHRKLSADAPVCVSVDAVLSGRRNNPPEPGIRSLAVYNPIHYQALPELFMDYICSLTGKSPSTTGAGSEGALTKGPFNALRPTADLNNALVSMILTGHDGFSTSAGHVGPHVRVDHDISLLVPEIWARLHPEQRKASWLIEHGYMEALDDFDVEGKRVLASRLGYRINERFVAHFMGKIFDNPRAVFSEALLKPETQDMPAFIDGVHNIVEAQERVAMRYFDDGSISEACPPLKALLSIMAHGHYCGRDVHAPEIRAMFTRESLLESDWYRQRLEVKRERDHALWTRKLNELMRFRLNRRNAEESRRLDLDSRIAYAQAQLEALERPESWKEFIGTLGADPLAPIEESLLDTQDALADSKIRRPPVTALG
jgi:phosphoenolpyruvate carboxykinase (diphosphate)